MRPPGIVYDDIEATERSSCQLDCFIDVSPNRDVSLKAFCVTDFLGDLHGPVAIQIENDNSRAFAGKTTGRLRAESRCSARDQRYLALKTHKECSRN
jgi:hypothetical protein